MKDDIPKFKIWFTSFFKSYVWLWILLSILGGIASCSTYIDAGTHLTPKSVNVSGYYRSDGTYVSSYSRRPPGGAIHDKPYENKRSLMTGAFFICLLVCGGTLFFYTDKATSEVKNKKEEIKKLKELDIEKKKSQFTESALKKMSLTFKGLIPIPKCIVLSSSLRCKFCKRYRFKDDCYISFLARTRNHNVCIECAKTRSTLGISQPISKFVSELSFADKYKKDMSLFIRDFQRVENPDHLKFTESELKDLYIKQLKKAANKSNRCTTPK